MNTPFFDDVKKLSKLKTRFFMPGHKGKKKAIKPFKKIVKFDITEIDGADDLQNPSASLLKSEENMAGIYNTGATLYCANGSTACIEAMLTTFVNMGDTVIMARNCHVSAVRACAFLNINPMWIIPDCNNIIDVNNLEEMIINTKAKAVYITSPNYYGFLANIKECARVCKKYNIPLLIDNAHGAYLKFLPTDLHPITLGADACADSLHKTLPCLTGASVLHLQNAKFKNRARWAINLFSSTSPSYLILTSIDLLVGKLLAGKINFEKAITKCNLVRRKLNNICVQKENIEPLKLTIAPRRTGFKTQDVVSELKKNKIFPEMYNEYYIVLMASAYNRKKDFTKLIKILKKYNNHALVEINEKFEFELPKRKLSIRMATFAKKRQISVEKSFGEIASGIITPCPPGIPVVMPGEIIDKRIIENILNSGISVIDVVK